MAINSDTSLNELIIHQVPSKTLYKTLKENGSISGQALCIIDGEQEQRLYKDEVNQMAEGGKIQMASSYTPTEDNDVCTKKYADSINPTITPTVGFDVTSQIYIGSTDPGSNAAALIWVDTSSSGALKYRTSKTDTWKIIPVAWS